MIVTGHGDDGVPVRPGSASPTRPIGVPAGTGSARKSSGTPSQASASGHQARSRSESIPVRDASDSSATAAAPSERATHSGRPSQRTAAAAAGAWERCQRSLLSVHSGEAGRPVCAANRRAPSSVAMARASSAPRLSCHAIAGPTGSPRRSSSTPVSAMPAIPTAATTPAGESPSAREATAHAVRVIATRIQLGPGRNRRPRRPFAGLAELLALGVEHERLAVRRADVDADEELPHR